MATKVFTFPSSVVVDRDWMNYAFRRQEFKIDSQFDNDWPEWETQDQTTKRNKFQTFWFMGLLKWDNANKKFVVTENGNKVCSSGWELKSFINALKDASMPYSTEATYKLSDKNYKFFQILFDIFAFYYTHNFEISCEAFEYVFTFLLNNENYNDVDKLLDLLYTNRNMTIDKLYNLGGLSRTTINYSFRLFENLGLLEKKKHSLYCDG